MRLTSLPLAAADIETAAAVTLSGRSQMMWASSWPSAK
jgi:hypothetical protein